MGLRREFLIRRTDGSWFDLLPHEYEQTLHPNSWPSRPSPRVEGYGISVEGCEVTFAYEERGIVVVFEGEALPEDLTTRIVLEVCTNITSLTGQAGEVVPVGS